MDRIFANTMIYFRKRAHLTQSELAIRTGITQSAISKFCEGVGISGNEFCLFMGLQLIATAFKSVMWFSYDYDEEEED